MLGRIGAAIGAESPSVVNAFLERIAAGKTEGGWVVIGGALGRQLEQDMAGAFTRCRVFIGAASIWYVSDILSERVPGLALLLDFRPALALLAPWRKDPNYWVRRAVGVSVHFWAHRSRGAPEHAARAIKLLAFLDPMFEEWEIGAIKGVGWGIETLGKYYPELTADWLVQVVHRHHRCRPLMLRKSLAYLPQRLRARVLEEILQ